jgi:predicted MPP superfamily phosphohydrolase
LLLEIITQRGSYTLMERMIAGFFRAILTSGMGAMVLGLSRHLNPADTDNWVDVTHLRLKLPRLAPEFNGYRLVQISDFHIGTWLNAERLEQAVALVNHQRPDLVAITGDFVTYRPEHFAPQLVAALSKLKARDGSVAVLGNHDHWSDARVVRSVLHEAGITELRNSVLTLRRGAGLLHVAGVDCYMEGQADLDAVLARLPAEGAAVLLAHEPDFADISAASGRFDLQISGHSHGGQIRLPGLPPPVLPRHARKYPSGMYQVGQMIQYTNRGIGTAELQMRINCRPEISVFTLDRN